MAKSHDLAARAAETKSLTARVQAAMSDPVFLDRVRRLLPEQSSRPAQVERFVNRAILYFNTAQSDSLRQCSPTSFIQCVIRAAELGFALDGRMCYAVPYKGEATFQLGYLGMVSLARRSGSILDVNAYNVHLNDHFRRYRRGGKWEVEFEPEVSNRGYWVGACCEIVTKEGMLYCDYMSNEELNSIRARSRSYQSGTGPWVTDEGEMRRKTVARRALKWFADDPFSPLAAALAEIDPDQAIDVDFSRDAPVTERVPEGLPAPSPDKRQANQRKAVAVPRSGAIHEDFFASQATGGVQHAAESARPEPVAVEREPGDEPESAGEPADGHVAWTRRTISERMAHAKSLGPQELRALYDQLCGPGSTLHDESLIDFAGQLYHKLSGE